MDEANPSETTASGSVTLKVRDKQLVRVTDDDVSDPTPSIDHDSQLSIERSRHFCQSTAQFSADPQLRRYPTLVERLELPILAWL